MAGTTVDEFHKLWMPRLAKMQAAGVDLRRVQPIVQADWRRVQGGASPYSGLEADTAIQAALSGQAGTVPGPHPAKLDWNPLHDIGVIGSDIGDVAKGLTGMLVAHPLEAGWEALHGEGSKAWNTLKEG